MLLDLGGAFIAHSWYFKPVNINIFFARAFLQVALESPEMLSSIHVLEQFGIKGHNAELDDDSMAAGDRLFDHMKESREVLLSYEDEDLSEADIMSKRIAMSMMDMLVEMEKFRFHNYPVNQLFGVQNGFPHLWNQPTRYTVPGTQRIMFPVLSQVGRKFDQVLDGLRRREELGILPPQFVVTKVLEEMRSFVRHRPKRAS